MNTSSRMMSFGQEQAIHVSGAVKALLPAAYSVKERGKVQFGIMFDESVKTFFINCVQVTVKGKGEMVTFWVEDKANRAPPMEDDLKALVEAMAAKKKAEATGAAEPAKAEA